MNDFAHFHFSMATEKRKGKEQAGAEAKRARVSPALTACSDRESKLLLCRPNDAMQTYAHYPNYFDVEEARDIFSDLAMCVFERPRVPTFDPDTLTYKLRGEHRLLVDYSPALRRGEGLPAAVAGVLGTLLDEAEALCGRRLSGLSVSMYRTGGDWLPERKEDVAACDPTLPVFCFSFGAERDLQLRFLRPADGTRAGLSTLGAMRAYRKIPLRAGSLLVMFPAFRGMFSYGIPARPECTRPHICVLVRPLK